MTTLPRCPTCPYRAGRCWVDSPVCRWCQEIFKSGQDSKQAQIDQAMRLLIMATASGEWDLVKAAMEVLNSEVQRD